MLATDLAIGLPRWVRPLPIEIGCRSAGSSTAARHGHGCGGGRFRCRLSSRAAAAGLRVSTPPGGPDDRCPQPRLLSAVGRTRSGLPVSGSLRLLAAGRWDVRPPTAVNQCVRTTGRHCPLRTLRHTPEQGGAMRSPAANRPPRHGRQWMPSCGVVSAAASGTRRGRLGVCPDGWCPARTPCRSRRTLRQSRVSTATGTGQSAGGPLDGCRHCW
jgi:hypothetical protein